MESKQSVGITPDKRFALLIDADNVSAKYIKPILTELSKYGTITYKRIYGDWTLSLHAKWKDALLENSITPIQQFSYTYGKNSTDSAMIIDAMDILYGGSVEGFCIVSSDSDFTRLASRLRESGHTVIGMGEKKTPTPFRKACDIFTVLELLVKNERSEKANGPTMSKSEVEQAVVDIIIDNQNNGKATGLGEIGSRLQKRYPDFDVRNYGTNLLSKLLGEFTRVKITKDHSSVAVELADSQEADAHEEKQIERPTEAQQEKAGGKAADSHAENSADKMADKQADKQVEKHIDKVPGKTADKAPEKTGSKRGAKTDKAAVEKQEERAQDSAPAEKVEEAAARPDEPKAEINPDKPARKPRRKRKITVERRRREEPRTPQVLIREQLTGAGEEGIALTHLGDLIKSEFKDFKVRDLGFAQLRLYIASVEEFEVFKKEKVYFARRRS
ncbi:MAG: NYN domain-containing protein [Eggerthellaceae bacterium]|nr:NYN domain-containing protein [Eggerthellaceae bacterium]